MVEIKTYIRNKQTTKTWGYVSFSRYNPYKSMFQILKNRRFKMISFNTLNTRILNSVFKYMMIISGIIFGYSAFSQEVTVTCNTQNSFLWTGSCTSASFYPSNASPSTYIYAIGGGSRRGFAKFDVSTIPSAVIVTEVKLYFYVNSQSLNPYYRVTKLEHDPPMTTAGTIFSTVGLANSSTSTRTYLQNSTQLATGWRNHVLNSYANTDLQTTLLGGGTGFSVGFYEFEASNTYQLTAHGSNQANPPYLVIKYIPNFANDIGLESILPPTPTCSGTFPIKFVVKNYGNNVLTSGKISWSLNGVSQGSNIPWSKPGGLLPGQADTVIMNPGYIFNSALVTIQGQVYQPNGVTGNNFANDNKTVGIQIINVPSIYTQPTDQYTIPGGNAGFYILATGGGIMYQWQVSTNNGTSWTDVPSNAMYSNTQTNNLNITGATFSMSGYRYRCYVSGSCTPPAISNVVTLIVGNPIRVTAGSGYACPNNPALVPIDVKHIDGISSFTLNLNYNPANMTFLSAQTLHPALSGGTFNATAAGGKVTITYSGPSPITIASGKLCDLRFTYLSGSNPLVWDTITAFNCSFLTSTGIDFPTDYDNGTLQNTGGTILQHPYPAVVGVNEIAKFYVSCTGSPTYQWQRSTNGGSSWTNLSDGLLPGGGGATALGSNNDTLTISQCQIVINNNLFRCFVGGCVSAIASNSTSLQVLNRVITRLDSLWKCVGSQVIIQVKVWNFTDVASVNYRFLYLPASMQYVNWQNANPNMGYLAVNGSIAGRVNLGAFSLTPYNIADGGVIIEFVFNYLGGCTYLQWDTVTPGLTMYSDVGGNPLPGRYFSGSLCDGATTITTQPLPSTIYPTDNTSFTVAATGHGTITYQWQVSTNGGTTWTNISGTAVYSGYNTPTLTLTNVPETYNTYRYRCGTIATANCAAVWSNAAILTVLPTPIYLTPGTLASGNTGTGANTFCSGDPVIIPLKVLNATNLGAISLKLNFDQTKLTYDTYQNLNPALSAGTFLCNLSIPGQVSLAWYSVVPANLAVGTIVELKFINIGGVYSNSPLSWQLTPAGLCQFTNSSNLNITTIFNPGVVNILPLPTIYNVVSVPGHAHYCSGGTGVQIGIDFSQNGINYKLFKDGVQVAMQAGNGQGFYFGSYTAAGIYTVQAVNGTSSCSSLMDGQVEVFIDQAPTHYNVTGSGSFCAGSNKIVGLSGSQVGVNYQLMLASAPVGTPLSGTGSALSFPAVSTAGTYTVNAVYDIYGTCTTAMDGSAVITQNTVPAAAGTITGNISVCQGSTNVTYTLSGPITGASSYVWTVPAGGATFVNNATSIVVSYAAATPTTGNITVLGHNECGDGTNSTLSVTIKPTPQPAGTINAPFSICQGANGVAISVPPIAGTTSYFWTLPTGGTVASGAGTASITANFTTNATVGNQQIKVYGINTNGCGPGTESSKTVEIKALPVLPIFSSGPAAVCQGTSSVTYILFANGNTTSYTWSPLAGVTGTSTTNSITYTFANPATTITVSVNGVNDCGNGPVATKTVSVTLLPGIPASIAGPTSVCAGSTTTYTAGTTANTVDSYVWTVPSGSTFTQTGNSATVTFGSTTGNITVKGHNTCGDGQAQSISVTVKPLPTVSLVIGAQSPACSEGTAFTLSGGSPAGGTYSGGAFITGGNTFNPTLAVVGTNQVTYTYTDPVTTCTNSTNQIIQVTAWPKANGTVLYDNVGATPMGNVALVLKNTGGTVVNSCTSVVVTGAYEFKCTTAGTYTVEASTTRPWANGAINSTDALIIAQFGVGTGTLSLFRQKAADVNSSGFINATDAMIVMKRFVTPSMIFPNSTPDWVWNILNPYSISTSTITKTVQSLVTGDVNGSWIPTATTKLPAINLETKGQVEMTESTTYQIPVLTKNDLHVSAISLVMDIPVDKVSITDVVSPLNGMMWGIYEGQLRIGWYSLEPVTLKGNERLFTLQVKLTDKAESNTFFNFTPTGECIFSDRQANDITDVVLQLPVLKTGTLSGEPAKENENAYYLGNNTPNPFDASTQIEYKIPANGNVHLSVFNILGKEVAVLVDQQQSAGTYQVTFDRKGLASGVYLYKLKVSDENGEYLKTRTLIIDK
jgi:hypothetical protein